MWWKKYLGNSKGILKLSRNQLENLLNKSNEELENLSFINKSIEQEVKELEILVRKKSTMDQKSKILHNINGEEIIPSNIISSQNYFNKLKEKFEQLLIEKNDLINLIENDELILEDLSINFQKQKPQIKDSLSLLPFNNNEIRKICNFLIKLKESSELIEDIDIINIVLELLNGDIKNISKIIFSLQNYFTENCENLYIILNNLIKEIKLLIKNLNLINNKIQSINKKFSSISIINPSTKKEIILYIKSFGDSEILLKKIQLKVNELRNSKEILKNEINNISKNMIELPYEETLKNSNLFNSSEIKNKILFLDLEINEIKEKNISLYNQILILKESKLNRINSIDLIKKEISNLKINLNKKKKNINNLKLTNIKDNDFHIIQSFCSSFTPNELIEEFK